MCASLPNDVTVSNKPGVCVKVLSLKPRHCQLEEEMAQLADAALPAELVVRRIAMGKLRCFCHQFWLALFKTTSPQVGFGELPFNRMDCFPTYPDICFRVDGFNFLCHKVRSSKVKCLPVDTLPDRDVRCFFYSWLQAFFCGRSDYFRALLEDHFSEGEQLQSHPSTLVITLHNISHEIFIHVMYYIYTDNTEVSVLLLFGLCLWNFLSFTEKNMVNSS